MDLSLKKSFKAQASFNSLRKISAALGVAAAADPTLDEEKFNLLAHREGGSTVPMSAGDGSDRRDEIVVKVDGGESGNGTPREGAGDPVGGGDNGGRIWRESSYDFWRNGDPEGGGNGGHGGGFDFGILEEDPPSKLIGQFLHKQKASGDFSLDMDLEMDELQRLHGLPPVAESPSVGQREVRQRVSFEANEAVRKQSKDTPSPESRQLNGRDGEVLRCTSNASFRNSPNSRSLQRKSSLLVTKTKSRLMDPPEQPNRRSCQVGRSGPLKSGQMKSGQMKSGFLGRVEDDEDDSLLGEDIPEEYKKEKLSVWILLEWVSLILIIASLICNLAIKKLRNKKFLGLPLWKWEVLVLVLICGRLVSGWVIRIIVFFIERNFLLRKRVLYFVYGLKKAVQNCLWLGLVLTAWHLLFDKNVKRQTQNKFLDYVTKILIALLVGVLLWLVKTLVIKVLASSFHVSTYFDRIQDSLFNQYVIETLSGSPLVELQRNEEDEERIVAEVQKLQNAGATVPPDLRASAFLSPRGTGRVIGSGRLQRSPRDQSAKLSRTLSRNGEDGITIDHLHRLNPGNVSAWNMKRLMNIVRHGALSTLDERILDSTEEDESATQIRSENEAKAAARKIFQNVARPGYKYICLEDLGRFLQDDEAWKTMGLFEGASESQKITKSALKSWVVNAFRERRALALSLNDTKTAVNKLHQMVNVVIGIIIAVISLLILGIATSKFLVFISSQLLLVAFIFGNTCKTIFEAIIFLFVMHPFDVGDRCEIEGVQMIVEEMNILTTVFLRYDNQKIMYPNSVLATKAISNYYRSPDMGDAVEFCVHVSTPADKIAAIKQRIISYVDNKKDHWYPTPMIIVKDVEVLNRVRIAVWLTHRMNHQDMGERWTRRAYLLEEMVKIFKELDIQYRLLPLDINVCALPPVTSTRMPPNWTSTN